MSENTGFFKNQFLVAMPSLADGNFDHTVTYLCEHNEEGALGLVINRPTNLMLEEMLQQMGVECSDLPADAEPIFWGGPVQPERGFVLHSTEKEWDASLKIGDDVSITTSKDILEAIAQGEGPEHFMVALGYAGWGAGQLESEIGENTWLNTPAEPGVIFGTPSEERWVAAARLVGVDVTLLGSEAGHA